MGLKTETRISTYQLSPPFPLDSNVTGECVVYIREKDLLITGSEFFSSFLIGKIVCYVKKVHTHTRTPTAFSILLFSIVTEAKWQDSGRTLAVRVDRLILQWAADMT